MRIFQWSLLLSLALPIVAHAQSTATGSTAHSQTGTVIVQNSEAILQLRIDALKVALQDRLHGSGSSFLIPAGKLSEWESDMAHYMEKSASFRASCAENLRRANRDTMVGQATACFRGDLMMYNSFLLKHQSFLSTVPLIDETVRSNAVESISNAVDAVKTIVGAIDAGLYEQMSTLEDAKQKLRSQYLVPYWLAVVKVQADRQLTFIDLMLKYLELLNSNPVHAPLMQKGIMDSVSCLTTATHSLQNVINAVNLDTAVKSLSGANILSLTCKKFIENLVKSPTP